MTTHSKAGFQVTSIYEDGELISETFAAVDISVVTPDDLTSFSYQYSDPGTGNTEIDPTSAAPYFVGSGMFNVLSSDADEQFFGIAEIHWGDGNVTQVMEFDFEFYGASPADSTDVFFAVSIGGDELPAFASLGDVYDFIASIDDVFQVTTGTLAPGQDIAFASLLDFDDTEKDRLDGTAENDTYEAGIGDDVIKGSDGDDVIYGGDGNDRLVGNKGDDELYGGKGDDKVYGSNQTDLLYGDAGKDRLQGMQGNDELRGGADRDKLFGQNQDDLVYGQGGDDLVHGGNGNDTLYGGNGNDELINKSGDATMTGGSGEDSFEFQFFEGQGIIKDFSIVEDALILGGAQSEYSLSQWGTSVFIDSDIHSIVLEDTDLDELLDNGDITYEGAIS